MRSLLIAMFATALTLTLATPADARRGGSSSQELLFVADTKITGAQGEALALCHLVKTNSILFINLFRSSEAYALAPNKCLTESYYGIDAEKIAAAKAEGLIPADVPDTAKLSISQIIDGYWGLFALGALGFVAVFGVMKRRGRTKQRAAMMETTSPFATKMLDVMCHAAKADGDIDASEIDLIISVSEQLTGTAFERAKVTQILDLAEANPSDADFKAFGKGLDGNDHLQLIEAALRVVAADGKFDGKEQQFVGKLALALKVPNGAIQAILNKITGAAE